VWRKSEAPSASRLRTPPTEPPRPTPPCPLRRGPIASCATAGRGMASFGMADCCMGFCRTARKARSACAQTLAPGVASRGAAGEAGATRTAPSAPPHHRAAAQWQPAAPHPAARHAAVRQAPVRQTVAWGSVERRATRTPTAPKRSIPTSRRAATPVRTAPVRTGPPTPLLPSRHRAAQWHPAVWRAAVRQAAVWQTVAWGSVERRATRTPTAPKRSIPTARRAATPVSQAAVSQTVA
jgi:hypothetical protein